MKKFSLSVIVCVAGFAAMAQSEPQLTTPMEVKTRFGIKGGVNLASLEIDDDSNPNMNTNSKTSFHGGLFVNVPISGSFRFQPEILYSAQGTKSDARTSTDPNLAGINEYDFHYISVPLMLQTVTKGGFLVELGPQFSYLSSANADRASGGEVNLKDMDYVKKTDFAAAAGIGFISRVGLGLNARYVHGFSNVWNNDNAPTNAADAKYKNRVVQISLAYHFGAYK